MNKIDPTDPNCGVALEPTEDQRSSPANVATFGEVAAARMGRRSFLKGTLGTTTMLHSQFRRLLFWPAAVTTKPPHRQRRRCQKLLLGLSHNSPRSATASQQTMLCHPAIPPTY